MKTKYLLAILFILTPDKAANSYGLDISDIVKDMSKKYNIPACVIKGVISVESKGNVLARANEKKVRSSSHGLMQVRCKTAKFMGAKDCSDIYNPETNIELGTKYIQYQVKRYNGDMKKALSAYNAGRAVTFNQAYTKKVLRACR